MILPMVNNSDFAKKRVLLVVRWPGGGIRTFLRYIYRHFDPKEFDFTMLAPDLTELAVLLEDLKALDMTVIRLGDRPTAFEFFKTVFKVLIKNKYDLVHSHGFTAGVSAALPAFLSRTKHILTSHDTLHERQFNGVAGKLKKIGLFLSFFLIQRIHNVSNDAQDNLLCHFPFINYFAGKSLVIEHGIELERFVNAQPCNLRTELMVGEDTFLIGFLGRFMSLKGFSDLVDAVEIMTCKKQLCKQPLVIAFGEGGFIREEKQRITAKGLMEYFRFMPFTDNVAGVVKGLDVVVMPSISEACGLLAMETLVCGTPLIATKCIGLREVLSDTPSIMIEPRDSAALAGAIEFVMLEGMKDVFMDYSKQAEMRYDVIKSVKLIQQLYIDVLES